MDKFFEKIADRFVGFFTRNVAPSALFFVLLFILDYLFYNSRIKLTIEYNTFTYEQNFIYIILIMIFLSYGYINQIFTQLLDNFIKCNYDMNMDDEDKSFSGLRKLVQSKLKPNEKEIFKKLDWNDYNAYQVLGKNISVGGSYVDEIKSIHTICVSIVLNIIIFLFLYEQNAPDIRFLLVLSVVFTVSFFHYIAKKRYLSRNRRLYINYLLKEEKKDIIYKYKKR